MPQSINIANNIWFSICSLCLGSGVIAFQIGSRFSQLLMAEQKTRGEGGNSRCEITEKLHHK